MESYGPFLNASPSILSKDSDLADRRGIRVRGRGTQRPAAASTALDLRTTDQPAVSARSRTIDSASCPATRRRNSARSVDWCIVSRGSLKRSEPGLVIVFRTA